MSKVYILIPHYERWDLTHARLLELYKKEADNIEEVIVLDDCSMDGMTEGGLRWWADFKTKTSFKVTSLVSEKNIGFLKNCNFGISSLLERTENDDIIILLSNDVKIMTSFVGQVTAILSQSPKSLVGGILLSNDTGWNQFGDLRFPYIEGWLLAMTAEGWRDGGGGFDERYAPCIFEDVDLSTRMASLGYKLVPLNNPGLQHMAGQTIAYNEARHQLTRDNQEKFKQKWIK